MSRAAALTPTPDVDVERALHSVLARRDVAERPSRPARMAYRSAGAWSWRTAALLAASVIAVVAAGLLWQRTRLGDESAIAGAAARVFETAVGTRDSVRLPDGTNVVLGPGTRLALAPGYGAASRELQLRGEAFFDVTHDSTRPFTVHTGAADVRDLGTRFAVHGDAGDGVRVVVTGGSVLLRPSVRASGGGADSGVVLGEGDRGAVGPDGRLTVQRASVTDDDLAWTRGRLVFRDAPLSQVRADLKRWYGIELRVADPALADRHVKAEFEERDPPSRVVEVIALSLGANATRAGDTVVLRSIPPGASR